MASEKLITLVTGGNAGLGFYAVQQLSNTGKHHVLLGSRSLQKGQAALEQIKNDTKHPSNTANIEAIEIDVDSDESILHAKNLVEQKYGRLDVLLNNAGISKAVGVYSDAEPNADGTGPSLREQYRQLYNTNVFGAVIAVDIFLPLLRKSTLPGGKRIAFTGSSLASLHFAGNPPHPAMSGRHYRLYRSTKTAENMVMLSYADELVEEGFVVSASNPGHCATNLNRFSGLKDPYEGAKALVRAAVAPKEEVHAKLVEEEGDALPW